MSVQRLRLAGLTATVASVLLMLAACSSPGISRQTEAATEITLTDARARADLEGEDGNFLIDHPAQIWIVSPDGEVVMSLPMRSDGDDLANDVRWVLKRRS